MSSLTKALKLAQVDAKEPRKLIAARVAFTENDLHIFYEDFSRLLENIGGIIEVRDIDGLDIILLGYDRQRSVIIAHGRLDRKAADGSSSRPLVIYPKGVLSNLELEEELNNALIGTVTRRDSMVALVNWLHPA